MLELYKNIRRRREELGLSQEELAKKMGYKSRSSINKIELGENDIPQSKIVAFAKALETTPSYLMGWEDKPSYLIPFKKPHQDFMPKTIEIAHAYEEAPQREQHIVEQVLEPYIEELKYEEDEPRMISCAHLPASAGNGEYLYGNDFFFLEAGPDVPMCVNEAIQIRGDSMEPQYHDKWIAWIQRTPYVNIGEVGVFVVNNDGYLKKLGHGELISLNPQYPPIKLSEEDDSRTYGRVVYTSDIEGLKIHSGDTYGVRT